MDLFECHVDEYYCNEQRTRRGLVWGIAVATSVMKGVECEGGGSECERRSSYSTAQRVLDVEVEALKSKLKSLKS